MKQKLIASFLLQISIVFLCNAQNSTWYYEYLNFGINGYIIMESVGDTTIKNKDCKILSKTKIVYNEFFSEFDTISLGKEYIHVAEDTTFRYKYSNFYSLYIFNGSPGDSYITAGNNEVYGCDTTVMINIDSVGVIIINSDTLRWVIVSTDESSSFDLSGMIVEKIGPIDFYMFPEYTWVCVVDANEGGNFRCFYEDGTLYYTKPNQNDCDYIWDGIDKHENESEILVYPNPVISKVFVELGIQTNCKDIEFKVFNILGNKMNIPSEKELFSDKIRLKLDFKYLIRGIYYIEIYIDNTIIKNSLIIKN